MSSNFFIRNSKGNTKRKLGSKNTSKIKHLKKKPERPTKASLDDGSVDSDEIISDEEILGQHSEDESDEKFVTAQEKKIALAKKYLEEIEKEEIDRLDTGDVKNNVISRLRDDILDEAGKLTKKIADKLLKPELSDMRVLRFKEHKLPVTSVVISPDNKVMFSGSKDGNIIKWSFEQNAKVGVILSRHKEKDENRKEHAHTSTILSLAVSYDNKYLASSDESSIIRVWDTTTLVHIHSFKGHRSTVTGLAFCCESNILYSCSKDRSIRIWNLDEMSFVETLFGHQCPVTDIDVLKKDRAVTSGGSDNTLRVWKVQEESQLIFNGHKKNIDRVRRLDQQHFVSCGDDGQLNVWGVLKKKPLSVVTQAHGIDSTNNQPNWISSVSSAPNSDLIVSGSCDGHLRFWKCEDNCRSITHLFTIPVVGFINSISFFKDGTLLVLGIGQEHRLGRWFCDKKAKNSLIFIKLKYSQ